MFILITQGTVNMLIPHIKDGLNLKTVFKLYCKKGTRQAMIDQQPLPAMLHKRAYGITAFYCVCNTRYYKAFNDLKLFLFNVIQNTP